MRVLITGSRDWTKRGPVEVMMDGFALRDPGTLYVFGDCPTGVDAIALAHARHKGYYFEKIDANWKIHTGGCYCRDKSPGSRAPCAGPRRNGELVGYTLGDPENVCYGIRSNGISDGTDDCLKQAGEAGIPCYVIRQLPVPV